MFRLRVLLSCSLLFFCYTHVFSGPFTLMPDSWSQTSYGSLDWGDFDGDGDLDLLLTGLDSINVSTLTVYINNGDNTFSILYTSRGSGMGSANWLDADNDGLLDFFISGSNTGSAATAETFLYMNNGDYTFSQISGLALGLPSLYKSASEWADFDGDGDLDLAFCGLSSSGFPETGVYTNNGDLTFTLSASLGAVSNCTMDWGDYDNDGYADLMYSGYNGTSVVAYLYKNGGGTFVLQDFPINQVVDGDLEWIDLNNDGFLDISRLGEKATSDPRWNFYIGDGTGVFSGYIPGQTFANASGHHGDWNHDGALDLYVCGNLDGTGPSCAIAEGDGSGYAGMVTAPGNMLNGDVSWADFDNSGTLDVFYAGDSLGAPVAALYASTAAINSPPSAPSNLLAIKVASTTVRLEWNDASDDVSPVAALTYNFRVGTSPGGSDVVSPMSDVSTGWRRVVDRGNAEHLSFKEVKTLNCNTDYYWSVQAVDQAYAGGPFAAEGNFLLCNTAPTIASPIPDVTVNAGKADSLAHVDLNSVFADVNPGTGLTFTVLVSPAGLVTPSIDGIDSTLDLAFASDTGTAVVTVRARDSYGLEIVDSLVVRVQNDAPKVWSNFWNITPLQGSGDSLNWRNLDSVFRDSIDGTALVYAVDSISDPVVVQVLIDASDNLDLSFGADTGSATVWISATDYFGYVIVDSFTVQLKPYFTTPIGEMLGAYWGALDYGDQNSDYTLDLLYSGWTGTIVQTALFNVDNSSEYLDLGLSWTGTRYSDVEWGDFDGDGNLDFAVAGDTGLVDKILRIYKGTTTDFASTQVLSGLSYASVAWGDADGDGDLDLLAGGFDTAGLAVTRLYIYQDASTFVQDNSIPFVGASNGDLAWVDVDVDGDLDVVVTGNGGTQVFKIYLNDGSGSFSELATNVGGTIDGSMDWADYDGDGDPDLLMAGSSAGGQSNEVWRNDGAGVFTSVTTALLPMMNGKSRWGDFDGDGDFDIITCGYNTGGQNEVTRLYKNNGANNFVEHPVRFADVQYCDIAVGDADNDGKLDFVLSGKPAAGANVAQAYHGNHTNWNQQATAPTGLVGQVINANTVKITWGAAADSETVATALTYNVRMGTTPTAQNIVPAMAESDGYRKVARAGNAGQKRELTITGLTCGIQNYWNVQAIDAGFKGGSFSIMDSVATYCNTPPWVTTSIPNIYVNEDAADSLNHANLRNVFGDTQDGSALTFTLDSNSNPGLVTATLDVSDSTLDFSFSGDSSGSAMIWIRATDRDGASVVDSMQVFVAPQNDAPTVIAAIADIVVNEDAADSLAHADLNSVFNDIDWSDRLTFSVDQNNNTALVAVGINVADSTLDLSFLTDANGVAEIVIKAVDTTGAAVRDTFMLTVNNLNDAPFVQTAMAVPDLYVSEDAADSLAHWDLNSTFSDIDPGDSLTFNLLSNSNSTLVTVSIDALDSTLDFSFAADSSGLAEIVIQAADGAGLTVNDTMQVVVTAVNDAPVVATPITDLTVAEDALDTLAHASLTSVFSDVESGSLLTYSVVYNNNTALVTPSIDGTDSTLDFSFAPNAFGTAQVVLSASDASGGVGYDTLLVNVTSVNDNPTIASASADLIVQEDALDSLAHVDLNSVFSDVEDGSGLTFSVLSNDQPGLLTASIDVADSTLDFSFVADSNGTAVVVIQATDAGALTVNDTIVVSVTSVNDNPTIAAAILNRTVPEDTAAFVLVDLNAVFADVEQGGSLTFSIAANSNTSLVNPTINTDSAIVITLASNQNGVATISIKAEDSGGLFVTDAFDITVTAVNDAPVISSSIPNVGILDTRGDSTAFVDLNTIFADPEGDALTFTIESNADANIVVPSINATDSTLDLVYPLSNNGSSEVVIRAQDAWGAFVLDSFTVSRTATNNPPYVAAAIADITVLEDATDSLAHADLPLIFEDPEDGDAMTFTVVSNSNTSLVTASINALDSTLDLSFVANANGTATIGIKAEDALGFSVIDSFVVTVTAQNDAPVVSSPMSNLTVTEDAVDTVFADLNSVFGDVDAGFVQTFTVLSNSNPALLTASIQAADSTLLLSFVANANGTAEVVIQVSDGTATVNDTIAISVVAANDAPTVASAIADLAMSEDALDSLAHADLPAVFTDLESGSALSFSVLSNSNAALVVVSINVVDSTLDISLTSDSSGSAEVVIRASDGAASVNDTFSITIAAVNDAPTVTSAIADRAVNEDAAADLNYADLNAIFSDIDVGDALTFSVLSNSNSSLVTASIDAADSSLDLSYAADSSGVSEIVIRAQDVSGASVNDTITVTVTAVNDAPYVASALVDFAVAEDSSGVINYAGLASVFADLEEPSDSLSYVVLSNDNSALVLASLVKDSLSFTFAANSSGSATVVLQATDGSGLTSTDTLVVTVNPQNDAPVVALAIADLFVSEDAADSLAHVDLNAVFSDIDVGDVLTFSMYSNSNTGLLTASINAVDSTLDFSFSADSSGSAEVVLRATDGSGSSVDDTLMVTVLAVSDAPVILSPVADLVMIEDAADSVVADLNTVFFDVDQGDSLSFEILSNSHSSLVTASVSALDSSLLISLATDSSGVAEIILRATDGSGSSVNDTLLLTVSAVNDAPAVVAGIADAVENEDAGLQAAYSLLRTVFTDVEEGSALTYSVYSNSHAGLVNVSIDVADSTLDLAIAGDSTGLAEIVIQAQDAGGLTVLDTFSLTVNAQNDAPFVVDTIANVTVSEDSPALLAHVDLNTIFNDVEDGGAMNFAITQNSNPGVVSLSIDAADSTLDLNFVADGFGSSEIIIRARDVGSLSVYDTFTVVVTPLDDPPVKTANIPNLTVAQNTVNTLNHVDLNDYFNDDKDGTGLTFLVYSKSNPSLVSVVVDLTDSTLDLTYNTSVNGASDIVIQVTDGITDLFDTFTVTVTPVDQPPQVTTPVLDLGVDEDSPIEANYADLTTVFSNGTATISSYAVSSSNTAVVTVSKSADNKISLSFVANTSGVSEIVLTATDAFGLTGRDSFTVTVAAVNDAPVVDSLLVNGVRLTAGDTLAMNEGDTVTIEVFGSDVDGAVNVATWFRQGSELGTGFAFDFATDFADAGEFAMSVQIQDDQNEPTTFQFPVRIVNVAVKPLVSSAAVISEILLGDPDDPSAGVDPALDGVITYNVRIYADDARTVLVADGSGLPGGALDLALLDGGEDLQGGTFYVEVQAQGANGTKSQWSDLVPLELEANVGLSPWAFSRLARGLKVEVIASRVEFTFHLLKSSFSEVRLLGVDGRILQNLFSGTLPAGNFRHSADLSGVEGGVYFVEVRAAGMHKVRRFVLLR